VKNETTSLIYKKTLSLRSLPSIRQLRAFVAVYHTGQLSVAAEVLALTQPAVTILLRELEEKLGLRLFDRSTRSLRRTDAAVQAIVYAERALAELDALNTIMSDLAECRIGRIRIAATPTLAQTLLPKAIRSFLQVSPGVRVNIVDCAPREFAELVLTEKVDFGVGTLEARIPGLQENTFLDDHLCAVSTPALAPQGKTLTWKKLATHPLIVMQPGYGVRRSIEKAAQVAGVSLTPAYEVSLLGTALAMAANGLGVAILPSSILAHAHYTELAVQRITRPLVARGTAVVSKEGRSLSPAARAFSDMLQREFGSRA